MITSIAQKKTMTDKVKKILIRVTKSLFHKTIIEVPKASLEHQTISLRINKEQISLLETDNNKEAHQTQIKIYQILLMDLQINPNNNHKINISHILILLLQTLVKTQMSILILVKYIFIDGNSYDFLGAGNTFMNG